MNLEKVKHLTTQDLMELQVAVNNEAELRKAAAFDALNHGEFVEGFALKEGKVSRVIADKEKYTALIGEYLGDKAYKVTPVALTVAESLIKAQFDTDDACSILGELKQTYGTKVNNPSLVYTGEFNE
jgi:hypothetical protein